MTRRAKERRAGRRSAEANAFVLSGPEATYGLLGNDFNMFSDAGFDMESTSSLPLRKESRR